MNKVSRICAKFFFVFALLFFLVGCTAYRGCRMSRIEQTMKTDTIIRNSVGDSIYTILMNSKEIKAISNDSTINFLRLNRTQRDILRFIIADVDNYESDLAVYGKFVSSIQFKYSYKGCVYFLKFELK